uniref:CLAVATA3/ESR (CLE)-related protein 9-like n=1 Tax=Nelumbo nucifera TaxID=4432 RepID=A0A822YQX7_NELNU|nr:TPA_asm: hypothetical protein HUJ06_005632 [Nelumbo nucifera]
MKSSPSSTTTSGGRRALFLILSLFLLLSITPVVHVCNAALLEAPSTYTYHRHHHRCNSASSHYSSLCFQLQRLHRYSLPPPMPPPPPLDDEIDPRYGVEKRLVPTGPNPLHN